MTLHALLVHDLVVLRAAEVEDRYSNVVKDWDNATRTEVRGRVTQRSRDEMRLGREASVTEWIVYLPAATDVTAGDRIVWDDLTLEVNGRPHRAFDRRQEHHIEALCDMVEG